jgi:hypothetical protein
MVYTKAVAIEQVFLRVNAGKLTDETTVKREDIEPYLAAACSWAWGLAISERVAQEIRQKRFNIGSAISYDDLKITTYATPQYDERKAEYFIDMPNGVANIGGNQDFDVAYVQGTQQIRRIGKRTDLDGIEDILGGDAAAYYLANPNPRIYIKGLSCGTCEMEVTSNVNFGNLKDDDVLPLPSEKAVLTIDKCVEFFLGQKFGEDNRIDNADAVATTQRQ